MMGSITAPQTINCKRRRSPYKRRKAEVYWFSLWVEEQKRRGRNQEELIFGNFVNESGFLSRDADLTVQLRSEAEEKQRYADRLQGGPKCPTNDPAAGAGMARGRTVAKWETPNVRIQ